MVTHAPLLRRLEKIMLRDIVLGRSTMGYLALAGGQACEQEVAYFGMGHKLTALRIGADQMVEHKLLGGCGGIVVTQ